MGTTKMHAVILDESIISIGDNEEEVLDYAFEVFERWYNSESMHYLSLSKAARFTLPAHEAALRGHVEELAVLGDTVMMKEEKEFLLSPEFQV